MVFPVGCVCILRVELFLYQKRINNQIRGMIGALYPRIIVTYGRTVNIN